MPDRIFTPWAKRACAAGVFALGLAVVPGVCAAAPQTVQQIANYTGADRQQMLEAGAKKEGALLVYTTGTQIQPLVERFRQKYPYIHVQLSRAGSASIARQTYQEYKAGVFQVDAFELSSYGLLPLRDENILMPFTSPEGVHFPASAFEAKHHWVSVRESYIGIGYNTKLIAPADAPKTYQDLLDPKWKGRMAISGNPGTAVNWVGAMALTKGADFVRKLGRQKIRVYQITGRALVNLMISGEESISPTTYSSHVEASLTHNAPLAWVAPGPVPVTDTAAALAAKAPHPHAAMLFIDFLMSKEGQKMYIKLGYAPGRSGMTNPNLPPVKKLFLANRPDYLQKYQQWETLYRQAFMQGK